MAARTKCPLAVPLSALGDSSAGKTSALVRTSFQCWKDVSTRFPVLKISQHWFPSAEVSPSTGKSSAEAVEDLLLRKYATLTYMLQAKKVIPYLIEEGILTIEDKEEIMGHKTSRDRAQALLDKVIHHGDCTIDLFLDVLRRSGHGHLADMLVGGPNSKVARTEDSLEQMSFVQLAELKSRLEKVYKEEAERYKENRSLEGLTGYQMGNGKPKIGGVEGISDGSTNDYITWTTFVNSDRLGERTIDSRKSHSLVIKEEANPQVGTALVADWVGDKEFTSDFQQLYKLKLNKVRKEETITDVIFDQLLHDADYKPSFSKESLWKHMVKTQEKILFVLEGLDRLNPFTSPEILQLIDKKLLPRATVIVTVSEANGGKCTTSLPMTETLVDNDMTRGTCTKGESVDVPHLSDKYHLANVLEEAPKGKMVGKRGFRGTAKSQVDELECRLWKVYNKVKQLEGSASLEGLKGYQMGRCRIHVFKEEGADSISVERWLRRQPIHDSHSLVVTNGANRHVGYVLAADWVGDKKFTPGFEQLYKLQLDKVRKDDAIEDVIFDQLLHDADYKPSFFKESLWKHMEQTQEKILFVLEGLDRLSPFTSPEILQLIDKKLLPRATVIVTLSEANAALKLTTST